MSEHSELIRRLAAEIAPLTAQEIADVRILLRPGFAAIARRRDAEAKVSATAKKAAA